MSDTKASNQQVGMLNAEHQQALKWAKEQNFGSVAARYAKLCAEAYEILRAAGSVQQGNPVTDPGTPYSKRDVSPTMLRCLAADIYHAFPSLKERGYVEVLFACAQTLETRVDETRAPTAAEFKEVALCLREATNTLVAVQAGDETSYDIQRFRRAGKAVTSPDEMVATVPAVIPRRPLEDDRPDGYLESDRDYVTNNMGVAVLLLDRLVEASKLLKTPVEPRDFGPQECSPCGEDPAAEGPGR